MVGALVAVVYVFTAPGEESGPGEPRGGTFGNTTEVRVVPVGTETETPAEGGARGTVAANDSGVVVVRDFIKDGSAKEDSINKGVYYLAGGDPTGDEYSIQYNALDQSFTISLLAEPLGEVRRKAGADLLRALEISQYDACRLRYQVLTPASVNEAYAGRNLGLSFCPGAVAL